MVPRASCTESTESTKSSTAPAAVLAVGLAISGRSGTRRGRAEQRYVHIADARRRSVYYLLLCSSYVSKSPLLVSCVHHLAVPSTSCLILILCSVLLFLRCTPAAPSSVVVHGAVVLRPPLPHLRRLGQPPPPSLSSSSSSVPLSRPPPSSSLVLLVVVLRRRPPSSVRFQTSRQNFGPRGRSATGSPATTDGG